MAVALLATSRAGFAQTTLQILHASDFEASVSAINDAPNFAAVVDALEEEYLNTLILSSGDNILPSPFSLSGEDPSLVQPLKNSYIEYYGVNFANNDLRAGIARPDITLMNLIGIEASCLGNHEFDLGTSELRNIIAGQNSGNNIRWFGAQFPYLSANLNFSGDANLSNIFESGVQPNTFFSSNPSMTASAIAATKKIASSTIIEKNGERFGIIGVTTPILASISSPGATTVQNPGAGTDDMAALAGILQPVIDGLRFGENIDKIILLAHLQQLALEKQLATLLNGVDIIIAGGSHTLMADPTDRLRSGDTAQEGYPFWTVGADGGTTVILNTTSEYRYVGRLVIDFDTSGDLIPASLNPEISGAYATDNQGVADVWGTYEAAFVAGSKGTRVKSITDAIAGVISSKDANIFGRSDVYLQGLRNFVRTEETNLGNISADANLWWARQSFPQTTISIKNGGGIRSAMGSVLAVGDEVTFLPPSANPLVGKEAGQISQLDIENSLRFNNGLSVLDLSAADLKLILEHAVAQTVPGATPGRFPQISGIRFAFNPNLPVNNRVVTAAIVDEFGLVSDVLVNNGSVVGDPLRAYKIVTLNFLASGGDGYPFPALGENRVDLVVPNTPRTGQGTFADNGSEQDAFAEYLAAFHFDTPYVLPETPASKDQRIQNLSLRGNCVTTAPVVSILATDGDCPTGNIGSAIASGTGGSAPYSFSWSNGSSSSNATNLTAGIHFVTVTDAAGCSTTQTTTIEGLCPDQICIDLLTDAFAGETFAASNGGVITGIVEQSGLEAGNLSLPVSPGNDNIGEPVVFTSRNSETQTQIGLAAVNGGSRKATLTRIGNAGAGSSAAIREGIEVINAPMSRSRLVVEYGGNGADQLNLDLTGLGEFVLRELDITSGGGLSLVQFRLTLTSGAGTSGAVTRTFSRLACCDGNVEFGFNASVYNSINFADIDRIVLEATTINPGLKWKATRLCARVANDIRSEEESIDWPMDLTEQDLFLYPNPNPGDQLMIGGNPERIERISLYDLNGRLVMEESRVNESRLVNIQHLNSGLYLVLIEADGEVYQEKLIISHR